MKWPEEKELDYVGYSHNILHNTDENKHKVGWNACLAQCKAAYDAQVEDAWKAHKEVVEELEALRKNFGEGNKENKCIVCGKEAVTNQSGWRCVNHVAIGKTESQGQGTGNGPKGNSRCQGCGNKLIKEWSFSLCSKCMGSQGQGLDKEILECFERLIFALEHNHPKDALGCRIYDCKNALRDALTFTQKPALELLDEESVYQEITNKSRPPYQEWERILARRICAKFATRRSLSKEEIKKIIINLEDYGKYDLSKIGTEIWISSLIEAIYNAQHGEK